MGETRGLNEAGRVGLLQQLLGEGEQPRMLQQALLLGRLRRERLPAAAARRLQALRQARLPLRQRRAQLPHALSQLLLRSSAVHLLGGDKPAIVTRKGDPSPCNKRW